MNVVFVGGRPVGMVSSKARGECFENNAIPQSEIFSLYVKNVCSVFSWKCSCHLTLLAVMVWLLQVIGNKILENW